MSNIGTSRKTINLNKGISTSHIGYDGDGCRVAYPDTLYSEEIYPKRNDTGLFRKDVNKVSLEKYFSDEDDEYEYDDEDDEASLSLLDILEDLCPHPSILGKVLYYVFTLFLALCVLAQMPNIVTWLVRLGQDGGWL